MADCEHRVAHVQHITAILREVAEFDVVAEFTGTGLRRERTCKKLQQGRFTRTIRPHEHRALSALDFEAESAVNGLRAIGEIDLVHANDALAAPNGGCGKRNLTVLASATGASTFSMRSIIFALSCAREAKLAFALNLSTQACILASSRC
jgi:hypothetical protein